MLRSVSGNVGLFVQGLLRKVEQHCAGFGIPLVFSIVDAKTTYKIQ